MRGKPGENIRPAAKRVEPEERKDTESGTVTIHRCPTEGPCVRAKTERRTTACVTSTDVHVLRLKINFIKLIIVI